jgi:hypothetical protein
MTDDLNFYCLCDLPTPPDWLIADVKKSISLGIEHNIGLQFHIRPTYDPDTLKVSRLLQKKFQDTKEFVLNGTTWQRALYRRYEISKESGDWIREYVGDYSQAGSQVMYQGQAFSPHTDGGPRRYILNYLIDAGGSDVATQWFQEQGRELVREGPALQYPEGEKLELVKSVIIPTATWTALFGKVIHSVVNLEKERLQLSVSFSAEEFLKLKERHGIMMQYHG